MAAAATLLLLGTGTAPAFAARGQVSLDVQQVISSPANASNSFAFRLTADQRSHPLPAGGAAGEYNFEIAGNATQTIGPITFTDAGIYIYHLQCATPSSAQFTIDQQVYTITFYVETSLDVVTVVQLPDGTKMPQVQFTQTATQLGLGSLMIEDPEVEKKVTGLPPMPGTFTFQLLALDPSNPMPPGSVGGAKSMQITGEGTNNFGNWIYTGTGTYRYTVSEVAGNEPGYTYDPTVYTVTDEVTLADGQLKLERTITNDSGQIVTELVFVNTYQTPYTPGDGPQTGDDSNPALWAGLLAGSAILLSLLVVLAKRSGRRPATNGADE